MTQLSLPFEGSTLDFEISGPNLSGVFSPCSIPPLADLDGAIREALDRPLGQPPLERWVRPSDRVLIISDDNTRFTPASRMILQILERLALAGVPDERVSCIMALGTHRYMTEEEMRSKVGDEAYRRIRVFNHEWRDSDQLVDLGCSSSGTPFLVNRAAVEADVVIGLGAVVPHHIPGFSGSGKIIQPGISGAATTAATHMLSCSGGGDSFLGIASNPVRTEMEEIADRVGMKTIMNVVLNVHGDVTGVFFGRRKEVFSHAVEMAREVYGFRYHETPDIVVANSFPCDLDFWQSHKAQYPAQRMVKQGGTIIICTPAPEGVSPVHGPDLLEYTLWPSTKIKKAYRGGEIKNGVAAALAAAWAMVREKAGVITYSPGIPEADKAQLGHTHAPSIKWALEEAFRRQGSGARVVVLTHAPDMLPIKVEE
jgi:nickel-dependent lactate racemase